MEIVIKRAYDKPAARDGYRVLVDRLWPRGLKKETLKLDEWRKDIAPSTELREWFSHDPAKFDEFSARYLSELSTADTAQTLLERAEGSSRLTLIYAAKDPGTNHAVVLQNYLCKVRDGNKK